MRSLSSLVLPFAYQPRVYVHIYVQRIDQESPPEIYKHVNKTMLQLQNSPNHNEVKDNQLNMQHGQHGYGHVSDF